MAKKKKRKRTQPPRAVVSTPTVAEAVPTVEDAQVAHWVAQREAVRKTTTKIVLFCILVGLATAAVMLAGGGSGQ
jgi:hypothetical protein